MEKLSTTVLIFCIVVVAAWGQRDETLFGESGLRLTGAWGGSFAGLTSFEDDVVSTQGGFGGLEFNKAVLVGFGHSKTLGGIGLDNGTDGEYDLRYQGLLLGFSPQSRKIAHPVFNFLMGGGELKVAGENEDDVFVVQPSGGVEINVTRWFRLGAEAGYRFVSNTDLPDVEDLDFSAFFMQFTFRFGWSWGKKE
jgi:hypothetical protein